MKLLKLEYAFNEINRELGQSEIKFLNEHDEAQLKKLTRQWLNQFDHHKEAVVNGKAQEINGCSEVFVDIKVNDATLPEDGRTVKFYAAHILFVGVYFGEPKIFYVNDRCQFPAHRVSCWRYY